MDKAIYLINPRCDFPTYFGVDHLRGHTPSLVTHTADLATPTLAAMAPDDFHVQICDQNLEEVDLDNPAPFVGITGKISQHLHIIELAKAFRERGKTVIIGGPYASLSPEVLRPHCDVLVRGEVEDIVSQIFGDLAAGTWKDEYVGDKPSLESSPVPRWDLYPNDRTLIGTLQTSRGCPFECEFCDVIQYAGRKQRHKSVSAILVELDALYRVGYRTIFLADDNFTVFRARAREVLLALRDWNLARPAGKVSFVTQVSIDAARDESLLALCAESGLTTVFIGIETPNPDSLQESKKRQNLRVDLAEQVRAFFRNGIHVIGGMIVGFDADGPDVFEIQRSFAMEASVPIFTLGALVAPAATPLHARLKTAGRLVADGAEVAAVPWSTNIVHPRMSREQLLEGIRWLANQIYHPSALAERITSFMGHLGPRRDPRFRESAQDNVRNVEREAMSALARIPALGPDEAAMIQRIRQGLQAKPGAASFVRAALLNYMQIRHMYDVGQLWQPELASKPPPDRRGEARTRHLPVLGRADA